MTVDKDTILGKCYICEKYTQVSRSGNRWYCKLDYPKPRKHQVYIPKIREQVEIACAFCGKTFVRANSSQRFCSNECSVKSHKATGERRRFVIFERDDFRCFYCGVRSYNNNVELHVDHVIPRNHGGESVAWNLVTACKPCNLSKSSTEIRNTEDILQEISRRNDKANISGELRIKLNTDDLEDLE